MSLRVLTVLAVTGLVVAGCAGDSGHDFPTASAGSTLIVTSPDFTDGGPIPARFTCDGSDAAPVVRWSGAKEPGAIVVLMTDRDAHDFVHWLVYDLGGASGEVGGGSNDGDEGRNDFGSNGYRGPCPPGGDRPHHYVITVYEFRVVPSPMSVGERPEDVVTNNPIAAGSITGTYGRA